MDDNVSKIKERLNVVDVVSGYLKLQKAGVNFKAPCPFHNEKTPSFFVSPERQIWHCFGCQKGGDIFSFVKEIEGIEFPEALRTLAIRAGVELEKFDSEVKDSKERLYHICEMATRFFEKQLHQSNIGQRAFQYLKDRGVNRETVTQFRLGFAPATWDSLSKYLSGAGYSEEEIVDAGLAIKRESGANSQGTGGTYDRFRSRIMFPVSDANGRVVGFTGRVFEGDEKEAKYINTPQTLIYDKSRVLYGLNHSRSEIRKNNKCLLVEGNMDAVMSYQAGVKNVVASSGTALTPAHLNILKRYTVNLDFCFDTDSAGTLATRRGIGMSLAQDFNVKVISLDDKECKDPADYVKKYGQEWQKASNAAKPAIEFYFDRVKETYDPNSSESKKNFILTVAPFIKRLSSRVERAHWVNRLAFLLRTKESDVESDVASVPDDLNIYENPVQAASSAPTSARPSLASKIEAPDVLTEALISLVIKSPKLLKDEDGSTGLQFLSSSVSDIFTQLAKEDHDNFDFNTFIKKVDPEKSLDLEFAYLKSQALWEDFKEDDLKAEFKNILNKLKQKTIHSRLAGLGYEIKAAESADDKLKLADLSAEFNKLTQELARTHKI